MIHTDTAHVRRLNVRLQGVHTHTNCGAQKKSTHGFARLACIVARPLVKSHVCPTAAPGARASAANDTAHAAVAHRVRRRVMFASERRNVRSRKRPRLGHSSRAMARASCSLQGAASAAAHGVVAVLVRVARAPGVLPAVKEVKQEASRILVRALVQLDSVTHIEPTLGKANLGAKFELVVGRGAVPRRGRPCSSPERTPAAE